MKVTEAELVSFVRILFIRYPFSFIWRTSYNLFMVQVCWWFFTFCLSTDVSIFVFILKRFCRWVKNPRFFPAIIFRCLCIVLWFIYFKKSLLLFFYLFFCTFSLLDFEEFILVFSNLILMCPGIVFFRFILFQDHCISDLWVYGFHQTWIV